MRPLLLEFQAFGSFPGRQVVDFEALGARGLFVVTGPTGTGKTTVFDAMVYALFGALPGGRSADGDPRSHFADAHTETFVRLDFEVDGVRYRVHRTPKQDRPKQRGEGFTSVGPTATVVKAVGGVDEPVETQASRCAKKCEELVGLDAKQFQRVVLLPQGKFTDFLIATDEDREKLLRQLFGGELFEQATKLLKDRMDALVGEVADVDREVERHRKNADDAYWLVREAWGAALPPLDESSPIEGWTDDELRAALATLQAPREMHRATLAEVQAAAQEAAAQRTTAETRAKLFDDAATAAATLALLEAERDAIGVLAETVDDSRRARPVVVQHDAVQRSRIAAEQAATAVADVYAAVHHGFATLSLPVPPAEAAAVSAVVQKAAADTAAEREKWDAANAAVSTADEATQRHADALIAHAALQIALDAAADDALVLGEQVRVLEPTVAELAARQQARDLAATRLRERTELRDAVAGLENAARAGEQAEQAYLKVMARFVATQAPRLAEELVDGAPCPVCGSCEHPEPAQMAAGDAVDHHAVDTARSKLSKAEAAVAALRATVDAVRAALGEYAVDAVEALQLALEAAEARCAEAVDAAEALRSAKERQAAAADADKAASEQERAAGTALAGLLTMAQLLRTEADRLVAGTVGLQADALDLATRTVDELHSATSSLPGLAQAATVSGTQRDEAEKSLAEALLQSGLASVEVAEQVALPAAEETAAAARVDQWRQSLQQVIERLRVLTEHGVPVERPDVASLVEVDDATSAQAKATAAQFTTTDNAFAAAGRHLADADKVAAGSADLRRRRDDARIVYRTCNGEAGMRVKLERWVLAGELERVTNAANEHLARMTNHRYRLSRSTGSKGGLGLEVFDAHTGRARATASLSGGEQFQASLSLALGLADVVSHGGSASGKQFEALFVDEGFGSLDPDALDDAISALSQLHAMGRMVGAITHVEAMKQQLHVGIEVSRLPDGKGSTLKVHP